MFMAYNATTKVVQLLHGARAAGGGFAAAIEFKHDETKHKDEAIQPDTLPKYGVSHVLYQHVQDELYKRYGEQNMQAVTILPPPP